MHVDELKFKHNAKIYICSFIFILLCGKRTFSFNFLVNCTFIYSFRFALSSMDMDLKDYDSRTALHISAAEGELQMICSSVVLMFSD